jgi:hypothetical protein
MDSEWFGRFYWPLYEFSEIQKKAKADPESWNVSVQSENRGRTLFWINYSR